jgi:hypothetical protein
MRAVGNHFEVIPVIDGNGDQLRLYLIRERRGPFGLRVRELLELCTGEAVEALDEDSFVVVGTGERLKRVVDENSQDL